MRKQLLSSVAAIAIAAVIDGPSLAADLPVKAAPRPYVEAPMTWTGWYLGGHLGYGQAKFETWADITDATRGVIDNKPKGIVGGMQAGYNWQFNSFVFGIEGDVSGTGWSQHNFFGTFPRGIQNSVDLLASLRGRLGVAFDRVHVYGTGGLAYMKGKFLGHSPGGTIGGLGDIKKWGYVFGGGVEVKATRNLSVRAEGLWYNFKTDRFWGTDHFWKNEFKDAWVGRLGANYHF